MTIITITSAFIRGFSSNPDYSPQRSQRSHRLQFYNNLHQKCLSLISNRVFSRPIGITWIRTVSICEIEPCSLCVLCVPCGESFGLMRLPCGPTEPRAPAVFILAASEPPGKAKRGWPLGAPPPVTIALRGRSAGMDGLIELTDPRTPDPGPRPTVPGPRTRWTATRHATRRSRSPRTLIRTRPLIRTSRRSAAHRPGPSAPPAPGD